MEIKEKWFQYIGHLPIINDNALLAAVRSNKKSKIKKYGKDY